MEQFLLQIFSDKWMTAWLFILTLYWVYKLWKFWIKEYVKTYEKNLELQRIMQEKKDLEFLKSVWEISKIIKTWDDTHVQAHKEIAEKIEKGHKIIWEKIEKVWELIKYQIK